MNFKSTRTLKEKTHTQSTLIYKTSPFPHWFILLIIAACFIAGIVFLIHNYSNMDIGDGIEILLCWAAGLVFIIEFHTTKWYFNKKNDLVIITKEYVVCKKSIVTKYKLSEIEKISWEKRKVWGGYFSSIAERYNYVVYIKFKTNLEDFNVFNSEKEAIESIKRLKDFLKLDE